MTCDAFALLVGIELRHTPMLDPTELGYLIRDGARVIIATPVPDRIIANVERLVTKGPQAAVMRLYLLDEAPR